MTTNSGPGIGLSIEIMRRARYGEPVDTYSWDRVVVACVSALLKADFVIRQRGAAEARLDAVTSACHHEIDAPPGRPQAEREAWAEGYTQACRDVLAALQTAVANA